MFNNRKRVLIICIIMVTSIFVAMEDLYIAHQSRLAGEISDPNQIRVALRANPNNAAALRGLAQNDLLAHHFRQAISVFKHELQVEPDDSGSEFIEGATYERINDYGAALQIYEKLAGGTGDTAEDARIRMSKLLLEEKNTRK